MPKIIIQNLFSKEISYSSFGKSTILKIVQNEGIDWMHACGAKGRCTTCKVIILDGLKNTGEDTIVEKKYRKSNLLGINERLACQCLLYGDITIAVPESGKMPHIRYSE